MSGMIERVARALAQASNENPDEPTGSLLNEDEVIWQQYLPQARAAIEAMRDVPDSIREIMGNHARNGWATVIVLVAARTAFFMI